MEIIKTDIADLYVVVPKVFGDDRGHFFESYNKKNFEEAGIEIDFIQDNQSLSRYGTIRGLHLQTGEMAQTKLVRVLKGKVLDVAVDLRPNSPTFKKSFAIELSEENKKNLLIPRGFAHGFSVLSEEAVFCYKVDNFYSPAHEAGIIFNDDSLNIDWKVEKNRECVSPKDLELPKLDEFIRKYL